MECGGYLGSQASLNIYKTRASGLTTKGLHAYAEYMSFGILIHRHDSRYADHPSERYQFPKSYLSRASKFVGNNIIYYEPVKIKNTRGYYATAKIEKIIPDPTEEGMYLALIESGTYYEFPNPVPFNVNRELVERGLYNEKGNISGRSQSAVRPLSTEDFNRIMGMALEETNIILPRINENNVSLETGEEAHPSIDYGEERTKVSYTSNRIIRDRMFRRNILQVYDERCAITGLKLINGGGRAEVQAAHIQPVSENGPDAIQNGLALSGTVHWMFDRGLISLEDNLEIKVSRHVNDRDSIEGLINTSGFANAPIDERYYPHTKYLSWHRDNCFKV